MPRYGRVLLYVGALKRRDGPSDPIPSVDRWQDYGTAWAIIQGPEAPCTGYSVESRLIGMLPERTIALSGGYDYG